MMYQIKHIAMQSAFKNICERIGHSKRLTELNFDTVIGCQGCNNPVCEMSYLVDIPQSIANDCGIISSFQPQSVGPHKVTARGHQELRNVIRKRCQRSADSVTVALQISSDINTSIKR